ncbi:hypothetical protein [Dysgonomonas sp. 520]|uniref:hypothetical protein n=1 Tax=Dysgonomonas sp. 520 TaxID=2302931 RepID=UPI0013D0C03D|nr:hypothetical protein [Dysgonomonas sp. 520]NDW10451.1 hypothetical protein [Dysgonomonas sp. 520]
MAYSWSEYRCFMGGRFVTGIRGFKYKASRVTEPIYAEGDEVVDVGVGNREYSAEMTALQAEIEAIISAGGGDPFKIPPFTIVHSFIPENGVGKIVTDVMEDCRFTEIEKAMEQGATFMEVTTPIFVKKIKYNTTSPY